MINLLPPQIKEDRRYGRHNRTLVMWLAVCVFGIFTLISVAGGGFLFLQQSIQSEEDTNRQLASTLEAQEVDVQIAEFKEFSDDLSTVTGILNKQYIFSNLLQRIGGTIPPEAVLSGISLTGEDLSLDLLFSTTSNSVANQILVNLNDAENGLFRQADTITITCAPPDADPAITPERFPCTTSIKVLFSEDSDFVLLNGLLTEQAVADAATNALNGEDGDSYYVEQVRIDGLKNTFNLSVLSKNSRDAALVDTFLRLQQFSYEMTSDDNEKTELRTPFFANIQEVGEECPASGIVDPRRNSSELFGCRKFVTVTFNLNPTDAERKRAEKEEDGIASLKDEYLETYRTNL